MTEMISGAAKRNVLLVAFILMLCHGCAEKYAARAVPSPVSLQWPYQPAKAKVTYIHSLFGFGRTNSPGFLLRAITGGDENDKNLFLLPVAVATGSDGRVAVADMGRRCVHLFIPAEKRYLRLYSGNNDKIISPVSVIFDDELKLYLADSSGRIFAFGRNGAFLFSVQRLGATILKRPTGLAYNPVKKLLYVVDTLEDKIYALNKEGEAIFSFGEKGEEEGRFNFPTHIFWSAGGFLYVTDSLNFRIQMFDGSGKFAGAFGHHGDGSGDLAMPKGIAVDRDGVIYVVDALFDTIQLFDKQGHFLLNLGNRGNDFGQFWLPSGIFLNDSNELYVCDTYNRRIQVFRIKEQYP